MSSATRNEAMLFDLLVRGVNLHILSVFLTRPFIPRSVLSLGRHITLLNIH
jgi:hypothetical protein